MDEDSKNRIFTNKEINSTLKASGLKRNYGCKTIVKNISLEIGNHEIVGLLGPNGAGKTTIFYMILGLLPTESGIIKIDNINITKLPIYKRGQLGISYLPQDISIFRGLTVEQNIKAMLQLSNTYRKYISQIEIERQTKILLQEFQIMHLRNIMAKSLSGGERRRLEIARALATNPKFLLLDEPFSGIDPIAILEIQKIMIFLKKLGVGILITDHNVRETLKICDRAYIVNNGEIFASGNIKEIAMNNSVKKIYLGHNFRL